MILCFRSPLYCDNVPSTSSESEKRSSARASTRRIFVSLVALSLLFTIQNFRHIYQYYFFQATLKDATSVVLTSSSEVPGPKNGVSSPPHNMIPVNETRLTVEVGTGDGTSVSPPLLRDHLIYGALDANGRIGYVVDPAKVRERMLERYWNETGKAGELPPMHWLPRDTLEKYLICSKLRYSNEATIAMAKHWTADVPNPEPWPMNVLNTSSFAPVYTTRTEEYERYNNTGGISRSKILCVIYTYEGKHAQLQVLAEAWGWRCDGFFAASTATIEDPAAVGYGAINLTHKGPENYGNMWQVRCIRDNKLALAGIYAMFSDQNCVNSSPRKHEVYWATSTTISSTYTTIFTFAAMIRC